LGTNAQEDLTEGLGLVSGDPARASKGVDVVETLIDDALSARVIGMAGDQVGRRDPPRETLSDPPRRR
jgi:hypothetical protein